MPMPCYERICSHAVASRPVRGISRTDLPLSILKLKGLCFLQATLEFSTSRPKSLSWHARSCEQCDHVVEGMVDVNAPYVAIVDVPDAVCISLRPLHAWNIRTSLLSTHYVAVMFSYRNLSEKSP